MRTPTAQLFTNGTFFILLIIVAPFRYILPIMVSVIVSKWVGDAFGRDGIYDEQVSRNVVQVVV